MATFEYTAIDLTNAIHRGTVRGWSKRGAAAQIRGDGLAVVTLTKLRRASRLGDALRRRVTRMDRIVFTRNLMTMMRAGMNLTEALASSREQTTNPILRRVIADAEARVLAGQTLSSIFGRSPTVFSPVYVAMIRVGERSGKLVEVLQFLVRQQEGDYRLLRRIRNALVYPSLIVLTMIGIVTLMMLFVIPKIAEVYRESAVALPAATAMLIGVSTFLADYGLYGLLVAVLLGFVLRRELRTAPRFRRATHGVVLRLPFTGLVTKKVNLAVLSRTLGMLTHAGLSVDESLLLASQVSGNALYQEAVYGTVPFVKRGVRLADIFRGTPDLFLPLFQKMVATGEQTGNLDEMFGHIAQYYDEDVEHWTANVSSLIEPVLLLATGIVVGGIALAVLFPLWNFANVI